MCLIFVVVAPVSWRVLFPERIDLRHGGIRLMLYGAIGTGVVLSIGVVVPRVLGMGHTFLTAPSSVVVCWRSSWSAAGAWGATSARGPLARAEARARRRSSARPSTRSCWRCAAHLDPHFLFNTLNAIAEWCREDGEVAEHAVCSCRRCCARCWPACAPPPGRWPRSSSSATRCSRCTACAIPDRVRVEWRCRSRSARRGAADASAAARRERREARAGRGPRGPLSFARRGSPDGQRCASPCAIRDAIAVRAPAAAGIEMVERRLALAYDGRASFQIGADDDAHPRRSDAAPRPPPAGAPT